MSFRSFSFLLLADRSHTHCGLLLLFFCVYIIRDALLHTIPHSLPLESPFFLPLSDVQFELLLVVSTVSSCFHVIG